MTDHITKVRIPPLLKWNDKNFDQTIFLSVPRRIAFGDPSIVRVHNMTLNKKDISSITPISNESTYYEMHGDADNYAIRLYNPSVYTKLFDIDRIDGEDAVIIIFVGKETYNTLHDYVFGLPSEYWEI